MFRSEEVSAVVSWLQPLEDVMKKNDIYLALRAAMGSYEIVYSNLMKPKVVVSIMAHDLVEE